jgi:hypothetical protein
MTDTKKPTFRPSRGFLTDHPIARKGKKSPFLKKLERAQVAAEFTEADLRIIGEHRMPPASSSNVVKLDQARRRPR